MPRAGAAARQANRPDLPGAEWPVGRADERRLVQPNRGRRERRIDLEVGRGRGDDPQRDGVPVLGALERSHEDVAPDRQEVIRADAARADHDRRPVVGGGA
jgi:hypothetical protein